MASLDSIPQDAVAYFASSARYLSLATVEDGAPVVRTLGSWALAGTRLFFTTSETSAKVAQIVANPSVSGQLLPEGQELSALRNLVIDGKAVRLEGDAQKPAIEAVSARNPRFRQRAEAGQLTGTAIFEVVPRRVKILDFSKGLGAEALSVYQD